MAGAGVCAVQLREKDLPTRELLSLARLMRERTARAGAPLLINDRLDLCWAVGADGVHLRRDGLPTPVDSVTGARVVLGADDASGTDTAWVQMELVLPPGTDPGSYRGTLHLYFKSVSDFLDAQYLRLPLEVRIELV